MAAQRSHLARADVNPSPGHARNRLRINFVMRRVVPALIVIALLAASLELAEDAAAGGGRFAVHYRWIIGAAVAALLVLAVTIGQRLWHLAVDLRRGSPGARLNRRLLAILIVLAMPPALVVYTFSLRFLDATIDNWFNVRLEQALDNALEVARITVDEHLRASESATTSLAATLAAQPATTAQADLDSAIDRLDAVQLTLFAGDGRILATASADPRYLDPPLPDATMLMRVHGDGRYAAAEPLGDAIVLRVAVPVGADVPGDDRLLQGLYPLPARLATLTRGIEGASFDFQRLKFLRGSLKLTFALILTFVLLLTVLAVVLVAFTVSRRLVAPVGRLAAAARAVGAGRYDAPLPVASNDELGFLVQAFGQMTRELERADQKVRRSVRDSDEQRAWLGAVLERLSAGVLGFDRDGVLRVANHAAETILAAPLARSTGRGLPEISREQPELGAFFEPLARHLRATAPEWHEELVIPTTGGQRVLLLRGAALPGGSGTVAVFDDLTVLNRAQRDAAWGEVARRLAHEVRNPLTPIQLAAERLRRRFLGRLPPDDSEVLDRATHTIVSQVEALKTMVNAFGEFSRPPRPIAQPIAINALLGEVLDLYENDQRIVLTRRFATGEPLVRADPVRLRQALHNLFKNALEAIGEERKPHLAVATRIVRDGELDWIEVSVADNGPGLPAGFDERWYEPYTTSKPRGTGLGLAVVKKIIEEHGGNIHARNRPEGGAEFVLRLPVDASVPAARDVPA
ncbi:MAG: ATP-binding protein [Lysobacterales bacterium]